ncbi:MAG TPA: NAD-dependent epimerase/dehydratase family protein [Thermoleophilaceae bacterium]|jgi:nucleoside-diphosphate-sugar epimerase|nr:NAD-dependent epimerase/dehydratase family protein [Thermoleophilaceae bacterium]
MNILVTGGTGFLASHLIPALQRSGHAVRALVTPSADPTLLMEADVDVREGDVRQPDTLAAAMRQVDAVFHLAAAIGVRRPLSEYYAVNVTGTENVSRAALAAGVKRLVYVSTTSVYKQGLGVPVGEDFPLEPLPDPYPVTKAAADALVQRMIAEDDLPASIVRTSTIYGPDDHLNFGRIAERLLGGRSIVIGSGRNRVPFTNVDDVVQGLLLVLEHERAEGQVYNIADDECPTQEELLRLIADELDATAPRVHIPYGLLYSAAFVAERLAQVARSPHAIVTRFGVALYGADNRIAIDKARQELGYQPRVPLPQGVSIAAAWYRARLEASRLTPFPAAATTGAAS